MSACLAVSVLVAACGPVEESANLEVSSASDSLVTPPAGAGFSYYGRGHLKNGTGVCTFLSGNVLSTKACSNTDASQLFDAY